jgi:hypothetical protein
MKKRQPKIKYLPARAFDNNYKNIKAQNKKKKIAREKEAVGEE